MKNLNLENLDKSILVNMTREEAASVDGGYSWAEFKQDCSDAWNDVKAGFKQGFATGVQHADQ